MNLEKQYREAMFKKIGDYLEMARENTFKQDPSQHTQAMGLFISTLLETVNTMKNVKDSNAFIAVANGLDEVLEKEFFSHIHGPHTPKKEDEPVNPFDELLSEAKQISASAEKKDSFNIKTHVVGVDDINKLPKEVRLKLAQALKAMGVPDEEINEQLKLGGF